VQVAPCGSPEATVYIITRKSLQHEQNAAASCSRCLTGSAQALHWRRRNLVKVRLLRPVNGADRRITHTVARRNDIVEESVIFIVGREKSGFAPDLRVICQSIEDL
jgi:hypothetical protein